jgi:hypothetical protein
VLAQPLSYSDLYTRFADAWRVIQADSLLDYGPGETTATFTDRNFPSDATSLSSLPPTVVQNALALVAAAGITDPGVAQGAALDYALTGDTAFIAADQQGQSQTRFMPDPVPPNPVESVGIAAIAPKVTQNTSGTTEVDFSIYRIGSDTSAPISVEYAVLAPSPEYLGPQFFSGNDLPSGTVTIPAGPTSATLALEVLRALGNSPSAKLEVGISAGADGPPVAGATASAVFVNDKAVAGNPALPEFLDPYGVGTFRQSGANWTLDLGTISFDNTPPKLTFDIANGASAPADTLFGNLAASGTGVSFQNGLPPIVGLAPGQIEQMVATIGTLATGNIDETLTFDANGRNDSGYSASLGPITLTILGTVEPAAIAVVNTPSPINFPNVHVGDSASTALSIANAATAPAAGLDASFAPLPAGVTATGSVRELAPGATDSTHLSVGIDTTRAGAKSGSIPIHFFSDAGGGKATPLPSQNIQVNGAVYRQAAAAVAPATPIVHVGDPGSMALTVTNADPADGYSENLIATLAGSSGGIVVTGGSTAQLAAGASDSSTFTATFSTASAGTVSGTATLDAISDGGVGPGSIDGLGRTTLVPIAAPVSITVDNYANPAFEEISGGGTLSRNGNSFTIDLGTIVQGSGPLTVDLGVLNDVSGPADLLSGSFQETGSSAFANALSSFAGVAAGQSANVGTATLDTSTAGTFTETITLAPVGSNPSGYSADLSSQTLTVTGTVVYEPYEAFLNKIPGLAADLASGADATQLSSDTLGVLTAAVSGAIGALGGAGWQQGYDQSTAAANTLGGDLANGSGGLILGDAIALYNSIVAGSAGSIAGNASPQSYAAIVGAASALGDDITIGADEPTLLAHLGALYGSLAGSSVGNAAYRGLHHQSYCTRRRHS